MCFGGIIVCGVDIIVFFVYICKIVKIDKGKEIKGGVKYVFLIFGR